MKTDSQYEQVFEDLMRYTRFTNVNQVKTSENLFEFFGDLRADAKARTRKFNPLNPAMQKFRNEMGQALGRLKGRPTRRVPSIRQNVIESRKIFTSFDMARDERLTAINEDNIAVYRSSVTIKKKRIIIFRDSKGRFAKPIKEVETKE